MLDRRTLLLIATVVPASALLSTARAAEHSAYEPKAFAAAQSAGRPILVEITAPWCPTCKAQRPILSRLMTAPRFKDPAVFEVDFDSQKDAVRSFGARMQSTLIVFKGGHEVGRSVGDTNADSIANLLDKAV